MSALLYIAVGLVAAVLSYLGFSMASRGRKAAKVSQAVSDASASLETLRANLEAVERGEEGAVAKVHAATEALEKKKDELRKLRAREVVRDSQIEELLRDLGI